MSDDCAGDGDRCLLRLRGASGSGGGGLRALAVSWASCAVAGHGDDTCKKNIVYKYSRETWTPKLNTTKKLEALDMRVLSEQQFVFCLLCICCCVFYIRTIYVTISSVIDRKLHQTLEVGNISKNLIVQA